MPDSMPSFPGDKFDTKTALSAATALKQILVRRKYRKVVNGEEMLFPGTLGEVVRLPAITARLENRSSKQRERGLEEFRALWGTLATNTRQSVQDAIGWYDPVEMQWDDKRSNRRPDISEDP
jgi:hypothetical protein